MSLEHKVLKNKKVDKEKELNLRVTEDTRGERIFVEFSTEKPRLKIQRSFQNTVFGKAEADDFAKSMKSVDDMKKHFKIK